MSSIPFTPMTCKPLPAHDDDICGIDSSTGCATCLAYWARSMPRPSPDQVAWTAFSRRFIPPGYSRSGTVDVSSLPDRDIDSEVRFFASSAHAEFREAVVTIYASDLRAIIRDEIERQGGAA